MTNYHLWTFPHSSEINGQERWPIKTLTIAVNSLWKFNKSHGFLVDVDEHEWKENIIKQSLKKNDEEIKKWESKNE